MQVAIELYQKLEACTDDGKRLDILFDIATTFLNFDEKRVLEVAEEIKTLADRIGSHAGHSYYHATRGRVFFKKSMYADCEKEFAQALDAALLTDDLINQAMCHDSLGILYTYQYNYQSSLESSHKALNTYLQLPGSASDSYLGVCYNNIGAAYQRMYRLDEAEESFRKGLEAEQKMDDHRIRYNILNNLCLNEIRQKRYDRGLEYIAEALKGFKQLQHKNGEVHAMVLMAQCHLGKGETAIATTQYLAALKILKEIDHKPIEIWALRGLGQVYASMDAHEEAIKYYQKSLALSQAIGDDYEACEIHMLLGQAHQALHQHGFAETAFDKGIYLAHKRGLQYLGNLLEQHKQALNSPA